MPEDKTEKDEKNEETSEGIDPALFIGLESPKDRAIRVGEKALAKGRAAAAARRG